MAETQNTGVAEPTQIDNNDPLHLGNFDVPGAALIPIKLTGPENYGLWSRSMRLALLVKNKLGFVDGTCVKSSYKGNREAQWERCDAVILSWISATVAPELVTSIMYGSNSRKIWNDFKERFDESNLTRIFHLWKEIGSLTQGTDSVTTYYSKLRDLWAELDVTVPSPGCECEETKPFIEHMVQLRLLQFLVGLNESFAQVRSAILLKTPVPSVNQAYAVVNQEENQRKLGMTDSGKEALTLFAGRNQGFQKNQHYGLQKNQRYQGYQGSDQDEKCIHCGCKGHLSINCYRLKGYPPDFKSKKGEKISNEQGNNAGTYAHNRNDQGNGSNRFYRQNSPKDGHAGGQKSYAHTSAFEMGSSSNQQLQGRHFSEEHYGKILDMLDKESAAECKSNMAGMTSLQPSIIEYEWIIDSGASHHITHCRKALTNHKAVKDSNCNKVEVPAGAKIHIEGTGSAKILGNITLKDVLHVPDFKFNLLLCLS